MIVQYNNIDALYENNRNIDNLYEISQCVNNYFNDTYTNFSRKIKKIDHKNKNLHNAKQENEKHIKLNYNNFSNSEFSKYIAKNINLEQINNIILKERRSR